MGPLRPSEFRILVLSIPLWKSMYYVLQRATQAKWLHVRSSFLLLKTIPLPTLFHQRKKESEGHRLLSVLVLVEGVLFVVMDRRAATISLLVLVTGLSTLTRRHRLVCMR